MLIVDVHSGDLLPAAWMGGMCALLRVLFWMSLPSPSTSMMFLTLRQARKLLKQLWSNFRLLLLLLLLAVLLFFRLLLEAEAGMKASFSIQFLFVKRRVYAERYCDWLTDLVLVWLMYVEMKINKRKYLNFMSEIDIIYIPYNIIAQMSLNHI